MEKKEKVEFILEQMRLCIAVKDYIRTQIISKKINTKFFQEAGSEVRNRPGSFFFKLQSNVFYSWPLCTLSQQLWYI